MKTLIIYTSLISSLFGAQSIQAKSTHPANHQDYAKVISADAVYRTIERRIPVEQCWIEEANIHPADHRRTNNRASIVGGVIGAVIGNKLGRDRHHKQLSTLVGSVIGTSIGNKIQNKHGQNHRDTSSQNIKRCETHYETELEQILTGYQVSYRYHGRQYSTFSETHPGKRIAITVDIKPRRR